MMRAIDTDAGDTNVWTLLRVAIVLLAERRVIAWTAAVLFSAVIVLTVLWPRSYAAGFSFVPQSTSGTAGIAGIAAQFGVELPVGDVSRSPDFYIELLASREVVGGVVDRKYRAASGDSVRLPDLFAGYFDRPEKERRERAARLLLERTTSAVSAKSGIVKVHVVMRDSVLVEQVARAFLGGVIDFDISTRKSQSAAERSFAAERVAAVRAEVRALEDRLERFLRTNREYRNSPALVFEHDRTLREITSHQQLYSALVQAYERSRIEEVRDTPMSTISGSCRRMALSAAAKVQPACSLIFT